MKLKITCFAVLLVMVGLAAFCWMNKPDGNDPSEIPKSLATHWLAENAFHEPRIRLGMSVAEVSHLLPAPHNTDTNNVWIWVLNYPVGTNSNQEIKWREISPGRGAFFIVFVNDKLATPLRSFASGFNPWNALEKFAAMSGAETEKLLGKKTEWANQ